MAFQVVMPRLGWSMEAGSVAAWRKKDGEAVAAGEILLEVESEKAVQEVEALESGILRIPADSPPVGTSVPVGTPLAWLLAPGEQMPSGLVAAVTAVAAQPAVAPPVAAPAVAPAPAPPTAGPAAIRRPAISPRAKRAAAQLGVDWAGLAGSGSSGRIVERDVRKAAASHAGMPSAAAAGTAPRAAASTPVILTTETDATDLVRLQGPQGTRAAPGMPSFSDFLVKLAAQAMVRHPRVNARFEGAAAVRPSSVDIGIAVVSGHGLVAPAVRGVQSKSLRQVARETAGLVERARSGRIAAGELGGGTLVVVDLGAFDLDGFAPGSTLFDCAVLGAGRVVAKQVVTDAEAGRTAIRRMMTLTLVFDARLVDPAPAARFLQTVKQFVEQPLLWLVDA